MWTKYCCGCQQHKSENDFGKDKQKVDGLNSKCRFCVNKSAKKQYDTDKTYKKAYKLSNRDKYNAIDAKRRAKKLNATPSWLTKEDFQQIESFYEAAKAFKLYTGVSYQVDHILPLQGENVSGLHVPWNLQILPEFENISKKNRVFLDKDLMW
jgi:hypothetical protein